MPPRVAIVGVGNCASSFVQGLSLYSERGTAGLWHPKVSGLRPKDVELSAAFDVDSRKVGLDLSAALFAKPNVAKKFTPLHSMGIRVEPGIQTGAVPPHLKGKKLHTSKVDYVASTLKKSKSNILLNLISSGSNLSSKGYAEAALQAGCAFVNCTPAPVVRDRALAKKFRRNGLPLIGDDLMSQFGGTSFHRGLLGLMVKRGVRVSKSYQLDVGGGSETLNTIDEEIRAQKRALKTSSVEGEVPYKFETVAGTTDYVDYMGNDRTSYFWFEGSGFLGSGITVDVYLRSSDGANAGNVLLDVLRATHACLADVKSEKVGEICAYGFKSPPKHVKFDSTFASFEKSFC